MRNHKYLFCGTLCPRNKPTPTLTIISSQYFGENEIMGNVDGYTCIQTASNSPKLSLQRRNGSIHLDSLTIPNCTTNLCDIHLVLYCKIIPQGQFTKRNTCFGTVTLSPIQSIFPSTTTSSVKIGQHRHLELLM